MKPDDAAIEATTVVPPPAPAPRRRGRSLALAAVALATGIWLGWPARTATTPGLVIPAAALHLGDVWAQSDYRVSLPLRNETDRQIEITHLGCAPCGCCKFEPRTLVIPPREERPIAVTIDLRPRSEAESQAPSRDYRLSILVATRDDGGRPRMWELSAYVRNALALSPLRLDFEQSLMQGLSPPAREAAIMAHVALADLRLEYDTARLAAHLEHDAADARRHRLSVRPREPLEEGPLESSIVLRPAAADGEALPSVTYQVVGEVLANVQAVPASVAFGPLNPGETAEQVVTLRSHTGEPFEVLDVHCTVHELNVLEMSPSAAVGVDGFAKTRNCRLRLTGAAKGRFAAEARFVVRAAGRQSTVVVPVLAHVWPPPGLTR